MPRIAIVGISGAGKSTLAERLCADLALPLVDLDALHHLAGWTPNPRFAEDVVAALAAAPGGWVVAGNYLSKLGAAVLGRADTVIWLDFPRWVAPWRAARRTVRRFVTREVLWNGNRERLRDIFASYHPIWWSWTQAATIRAQIAEALDPHPDLQVFRISDDAALERAISKIRNL